DIRFQLLGMFDFIAGPGGQGQGVAALRAGDFDRFATLYNGPGQARYYGDLIDAHVRAFHRLKPAPRATTSTGTSSSGAAASTVTKPSTATKPKSTPSAKRETVVPTGSYEVRAGDTLGVIAGRFGVALGDLVAVNAIANPDLIHVGQVIAIPSADPAPPPVIVPSAPPEDVTDDGPRDGHQYVVRPGDTLGAIAARAQTTFEELARVNGIANPDLIFPGQVILTPVALD
ncbi:MAG: LysM peptidoglycan-binding domain-containing protein, partial [Actinomycetota bacterium]